MRLLVAGLVFLLTLTAIRRALQPAGDDARIQERLFVLARPSEPEKENEVPFRERIVRPAVQSLGAKILRFTPRRQLANLGSRLEEAGDPMTASQFALLRMGTAAVGLLPVLLGGRGVLIGLATCVLGIRLPDFWLSKRIRERQQRFGKILPDALDLLAVSVEAGMGFDQALDRLTSRIPSPVREEFAHTLREIRLGRSRSEALTDLAERIALPELRQFVGAVVQAEALGVSLARPLRVQADTLRMRRRQKAEEQAMKTPIKLLFPLVFLVFPALFVVLLGPAALSFMKVLHP